MTIRIATPEDARPIAVIHVHAWKQAYRGIVPDEFLSALSVEEREEAWRKALAAGHPTVWVAHDGDEMLGWVSADASRDEDASSLVGEIWALYIAPEYWRKRVGHLLFSTAEQDLREKGFIDATVWVLNDNERALKFYRAVGFFLDKCEEKSTERGGKALRQIRLRKQLSQ